MQLVALIIGDEKETRNACNLLEKNIFKGAMLSGVQKLIMTTNKELYYKTKKEFNFLNQSMSFIVGTFEQNTTAAMAVAAAHIAEFYGKDTLILVSIKKHLAINQYAFEHTISIAKKVAATGNLVTFGMCYYETNAQYDIEEEDNNKLQQEPLASGQLSWNSNLFLFKADTILEALSMHRPDVLSATLDCLKHCELTEENNSLTLKLNPFHFAFIPQCSINEEVIKKFSRTVVFPCGLEWLGD